MKVMIGAGGTGGHIYPSLALAEILSKKKGAEVVFWGSNQRMESTMIPKEGYPFYGADMVGMSGGVMAKIDGLRRLLAARKEAFRVLKKEKPDVVVGFGNYITVPLIEAAHRLHIPTLLHEQNSFAGKANRYLSRIADGIAICYEENYTQMPKAKHKMRLIGNPESTIASQTTFTAEDLSDLGLDPLKPFIVFMMGSLGSDSVAGVIDRALDLFDESFQIVIATGKGSSYTYRHTSNEKIAIVPYVDGKKMLKGCQLAIVRSGATTMAEIAAIGCASILIPSPYVPNNHQYYNAKALVDKGAAILLEEKDLTEESLSNTVNELMRQPKKMKEIRDRAKALAQNDAAYAMCEWIEELAHGTN